MQRTQAIIPGMVAVTAIALIVLIVLSGGSTDPDGGAQPSAAVASASAAAPASSQELNAELLDRRWTVLFVGLDTDSARESRGEPVNSDALLLVSTSADQSEVALVSLPRDTVDIPLPDGSTYDGKVNGLYAEEGLDGLVMAVESLFDVPIDGYLALDMDDFAALVDGVGGVEVSPDEPIQDPAAQIDIDAGTQTIDGPTAAGYVRTRYDQDYGRMRRQQEVIVEIVRALADPDGARDVRSLIDGLESLDTDLPLDDLATLLEVARRATDAEVRQLIIEPPLITFEGDRGDGRGYVLEPDLEAIRAAVGELVGEE